MNTNQIKKFACEARNILKKGIRAKILTLGFDDRGQVAERMMPQLVQGGAIWNGRQYPEGFYNQWMALYRRVKEKGIQEVFEEAAYIWFNRLVAIRILQKNGLCEPVLAYTNGTRTPRIVDEARMGRLPQMSDDTRRHLAELLDDDTKVTEQFALLITAWCHSNPIIQACFGSMGDFTELLLPVNILAEGGFVDLLNHTEFITDEDFHSPELIGWLYQFYISERKDEVFAKKGKFEADEIPAATQIFTPNWIVKYMVQNTVGRIFLDNNPSADSFHDKWQYLVEPAQTVSPDNCYHYNELTDLKVADLACGSGHILNECFDLLYDLYIYEGYSRSEAIESIFAHNLTGIDIDNRAKQLSMFSLLLKACKKDVQFADTHCLPHVLTMPDCNADTWVELKGHLCCALQLPAVSAKVNEELADAFMLMADADSLGSIMKFSISNDTRDFIMNCIREQAVQHQYEENFKELFAGFEVILALMEKYSALVMNPPYMGGGNMNEVLSKYVKKNYEESKADLFSVFMDVAIDRLLKNGKYGMINMQSWMFLSSFEKLRKNVLDNQHIDSMLHLGPRTFDELSGEVVQNTSFVISNNHEDDAKGSYFRLVDGKNCGEKERMFLNYSENDAKIYYPAVPQTNFEKIPGNPIGYWVSEKILTRFAGNLALSDVVKPLTGLQTSDNARFLRYWHEVSLNRIGLGCENAEESVASGRKWFPYNKGGGFRKWYGNQWLLINWKNNGEEIKSIKGPVLRNPNYYFKKSISWSLTSSVGCGFRYNPKAALFDVNGMSLFPNSENDFYYLLGSLNTKPYKVFGYIINPTLALQCGDVARFPISVIDNLDRKDVISEISECNFSISKLDWDAHETSWDFQENELLRMNKKTSGDMEQCLNEYKEEWTEKFMQLHANEEELNRQFIDIYGLQDELTPDVPLDEITILQQGEITIE